MDGLPVDRFCQARGLSLAERLQLFQQVCSAVHFAHRNLVVHRDLKPSNILVGSNGVPKLLDFGIGKILTPEGRTDVTSVADRLMTPDFASPEQIASEPLTTSTDVYSLGVLLFLLLTRRLPRTLGDKPHNEMNDEFWQPPPRPSIVVSPIRWADGAAARETATGASPRSRRRARDMAEELDNIVLKASRREPQERYSSAEQFAQDVQRVIENRPVLARPPSVAYRIRKFIARPRFATAAALLASILVTASSVTTAVLWRQAVFEREEAVRESQRAERVSDFLERLFRIPDPAEARGEEITAREILEQGRERLLGSLEDEPLLRADLLGTMGKTFRGLGLYEEAQPLLVESLALRRAELGDDHPQVATSLHQLAYLHRLAGDDVVAEPLLRQAIAIQRSSGLWEDPDYARG
ncbi:MAG: protein kinase, partial [bacterium]|nr:protein kinase [bacterium]